eukprot:1828725-Pleurochrysis_carterae.AAC.1
MPAARTRKDDTKARTLLTDRRSRLCRPRERRLRALPSELPMRSFTTSSRGGGVDGGCEGGGSKGGADGEGTSTRSMVTSLMLRGSCAHTNAKYASMLSSKGQGMLYKSTPAGDGKMRMLDFPFLSATGLQDEINL